MAKPNGRTARQPRSIVRGEKAASLRVSGHTRAQNQRQQVKRDRRSSSR